jgi:hypothetical protein
MQKEKDFEVSDLDNMVQSIQTSQSRDQTIRLLQECSRLPKHARNVPEASYFIDDPSVSLQKEEGLTTARSKNLRHNSISKILVPVSQDIEV